MQLMLFNGSPRGAGSNTAILLKHFTKGFTASQDNTYEQMNLIKVSEHRAYAEKFKQADAVIIAFPLYADSMPAIVKDFIETLGVTLTYNNPDKTVKIPALGFIVQSGFPEAMHSRYVEKYLIKLARRLNMPYIGTVIRGGVEGIQVMPPYLTRRLFMAFTSLGRHFGVTKEFHPRILKSLAGKDRNPFMKRMMLRLVQASGLANMYWNMMLKEHNAYERRFDRPYAP